ncbi:MAG TPA: SDR family oxidoreductase [Candidatus Sulfotelmatobacter sp.]|nr:SDR family oxidoreductase [Candidatus Sulfotelmatobacter sp.]
MDLGIAGKLALITGGSSGIGRAVALGLAAEGARIAVAARRGEELDEVVAAARAAGSPQAHGYAVDLTDPASIAKLLDQMRAAQGDPQIAVLNGGGPKPGAFTDMQLADWDAAYQLLLRSMLQLVEAVLPPMRAGKWGRIVNLASTSIKAPIPNLALSNTFRAGLLGALKTLSREVAADNVTVNVIATGRILTDRARSMYNDPAAMQKAAAEIPAKHFASPEEYAPLVVFLCSQAAGYVTGTTIPIDGGLLMGLS